MEALVAVVLIVGGYVVSLYIHPYVKCGTCNGGARHRGALFSYAARPCHGCSGTGQQQRLGSKLLGRGQRRRSSSRIQPPTSSFHR